MEPRIDVAHTRPALRQAMRNLQREVQASGLEHQLLELVKIRASQINGCAYCIDMHTKDARTMGETEQRIYALSAWEEAPFFTDRERAALEWTDVVTRVAESHVPDAAYQRVRQHFNEDELVSLTYAIVAINGWNRIAIAFRMLPGSYEPAKTAARA